MIYYINTFIEDTLLLHLCLKRLFEVDKEARVVIANDSANPIPADMLPHSPRIKVIKMPYPSGGNLNGTSMIEGMLSTMVSIMEATKERHIVKLDCDVWLNSTEWLRVGHLTQEGTPEPDYIGLERFDPMTPSGGCYRLSIFAARAALKEMRARNWPKDVHLPEDVTILQLILRSRLPVLTIPHYHGRYVGMHASLPEERHLNAWAVHCGEPCADGTRSPRDFVLLRMRLLDAVYTPKTITKK